VRLYHKLVTTSTNWIGKNAVLFNTIGWEPRAPHPNLIPARSRRSGLSCDLPRVPHFGPVTSASKNNMKPKKSTPRYLLWCASGTWLVPRRHQPTRDVCVRAHACMRACVRACRTCMREHIHSSYSLSRARALSLSLSFCAPLL
jgi:hypothetical protein